MKHASTKARTSSTPVLAWALSGRRGRCRSVGGCRFAIVLVLALDAENDSQMLRTCCLSSLADTPIRPHSDTPIPHPLSLRLRRSVVNLSPPTPSPLDQIGFFTLSLTRMWKGRFQQETAAAVQRFSESISFDWRLYRFDIQGSIAHASALQKAGLLTPEERQQIESGLKAIEQEIDEDRFQFRTDLEDIHMNIEAALTSRIGAAGAKLHTARSRNDQIALDLRLYLRHETDTIVERVRALQRALVELGGRCRETILPGYTHLQRAQPVLFAHHLLAYVEMLERDRERLLDARKRINRMPLGSGAIAGSTIPLDREYVASLLGFPTVTHNSMDAVSDRDFAAELVFAVALAGVHLSRLSEDLILFASAEFRFIRISDAYSTGSSLMPQKKNPDVCELTRGKSGRFIGNLVALLTTLKGLPMTYN